MNARKITTSLFTLALALTCPLAVADPPTCDPEMATPPSEETQATGWFQQLFASSGKPQPFVGAVMDDPVDGCQLSAQARPVASNERPRSREFALD